MKANDVAEKRSDSPARKAFFRENARLLICTALAFVAGMLAGASLRIAAEERKAAGESAETGVIGLVSVLPSTGITLETCFAVCGHTVSRELDNASYVGFSEAEMAEHFFGADFTEFSSKRVVMRRSQPGCCPEHVLLKSAADGTLRVYQTEADTFRQRELQHLGETPALLDESVAAELAAGVAFDSIDEINAYLESVES